MIQAVIVKLHKLLRQNTSFRIYRRRVIEENRWRASRYGIEGKLIDFGRRCEVETRSLINEILEFIAPEVRELGSEREMAHIERILREGTGRTAIGRLGSSARDERRGRSDHSETYEGLKSRRRLQYPDLALAIADRDRLWNIGRTGRSRTGCASR